MSEQPTAVEKQEAKQSADLKMSGPLEPSIADIIAKPDEYEFQIREFLIAPRVDVMKSGRVVKVIDNINQQKYAGTINEEYADKFLADLTNDFKIGLAQAFYNQQRQRLAAAQKAAKNQG